MDDNKDRTKNREERRSIGDRLPAFTVDEIMTRSLKDELGGYLYGYDPNIFWGEMGKVYHHTFSPIDDESTEALGKNPITLNIKHFLARMRYIQPKSVLEVGCGFGRILATVAFHRKLLGVERYVGIEFSPTMVENSQKFFKAQKILADIPHPEIIQANAKDIPFADKSFEFVYTHVCLTHIPPVDIPKVQSEINRVAKNVIIHIERYRFPYEHSDPHRWTHDIVPYYLDNGWYLHEAAIIREEHSTAIYVFFSEQFMEELKGRVDNGRKETRQRVEPTNRESNPIG